MNGLSYSTKSLASGIATVSKPNLMSEVGRVREVVCVDQFVSRRENSVLAIP